MRVVEFGGFAAGPVVGKYLANYGADVIRIESHTRPDGFRTHYPPFKDNIPGVERSGIFNYFNDGKRSIALNLKTTAGVDIARRLVAGADVLVENFTPGTIARLGLGYESFSQENPKLVMLSTCNQGQTGPHASHPGFGSQLTSLSGFTHYLGQRDGEPVLLYGPYIDYIAVGYGTAAVLAALWRSRRTGLGSYLDLSQYESGIQFLSPAMLDLFVNKRVTDRDGNRHPTAAPHGVFPCRGDDRWVALSVHEDDEWTRLVEAMGAPSWALDPSYASRAGRKEQEDRIEQRLSAWTAEVERDEVVARLRAAHVHVYAVLSMADLFADPQMLHRGVWQPVKHEVMGLTHVAAPPALLSDTPPHFPMASPLLGEHTRAVLSELLGLSDEQIARLDAEGVLT